MTDIHECTATVNGFACRIWSKGAGEPVGFLAGPRGLPRWTEFLDRLAEGRRVVVPSLPGFAGGLGHRELDDYLDWLLATRDLLGAAGLDGCDLIGSSVSGPLAADVAALWPDAVRRLVLIAPFGSFDPDNPVADIWAQRPSAEAGLMCARPDRYRAFVAPPAGCDLVEWEIMIGRAAEASARFLFPFGEIGLAKRLPRVKAPVMMIRGSNDNVVPLSQVLGMARLVSGPVRTHVIDGAGHLADLDEPDLVADAVMEFIGPT